MTTNPPTEPTVAETASEYVERVISKSKEYYAEPEKMIDEQIRLLEGVKENYKNKKDDMWRIAVGVSEAYHICIWWGEKNNSTRLVNTIVSFLNGGGGTVL